MTPISSNVSRRCPGIIKDGRTLDVTISDLNDGTLTMKWTGLRKEHEITFSFKDLMEYAEGGGEPEPETPAPDKTTTTKGVDRNEWCRYEDLRTRVHILTGVDTKERAVLVGVINDLELHHQWLCSGATVSWEQWKKNSEKGIEE